PEIADKLTKSVPEFLRFADKLFPSQILAEPASLKLKLIRQVIPRHEDQILMPRQDIAPAGTASVIIGSNTRLRIIPVHVGKDRVVQRYRVHPFPPFFRFAGFAAAAASCPSCSNAASDISSPAASFSSVP